MLKCLLRLVSVCSVEGSSGSGNRSEITAQSESESMLRSTTEYGVNENEEPFPCFLDSSYRFWKILRNRFKRDDFSLPGITHYSMVSSMLLILEAQILIAGAMAIVQRNAIHCSTKATYPV